MRDLFRSLLGLALEREWVQVEITCGCGCNCFKGHEDRCPECRGHGEHNPGCGANKVLREAEAWLEKEDACAEVHEEGVWAA